MFTLVIGNKNYSSWSLRPWLILRQANIPFTEIRIPLDTPQTHDQIRQYSPSGKVPVLLTAETTIWDSLAIAEYLAEQYPDAHLWPELSSVRAIARSVSAEMHSSFAALRQNLSMDIRAHYQPRVFSPPVQADIDRITQIWQACREHYGAGGPFLFGTWTIADAMYVPVALRFVTYGVVLDTICQAYLEALLTVPALQDWIKAAEQETEVLLNH